MAKIRINKYLSLCGVTSRRGADTLIAQGKVSLNGKKVDQLGVVVDEENDLVKVDGIQVEPVDKKYYVAMNKPPLTMTTLHDPFKRRTVLHFLKDLKHRVYPVGRLDYDTEGLLLLTNDGEFAYRMTHPKYKVPRIYEALVEGEFTRENADRIARGVKLDDGATGKAQISILGHRGSDTRIRLILTEGRKREIKQLCKAVGHAVRKLRRVEYAGVTLSHLKPGQWRHLTSAEVSRIRQILNLASD